MSEKMTASKEQLKPDPRYGSRLVSKFVNCLMYDGKKATAQAVFYRAMEMIQEKIPERNALEIFDAAVENCKPSVEVKSRRVGGANYQVPVPVREKRQLTLSIRWLLAACRGKKGRPMDRKLADEFMAAFRREGTAITTRENIHRMADANKAFAHFAW